MRSPHPKLIDPYVSILRGMGHRVYRLSSGNREMASVVSEMFSPSPTPFDAYVHLQSARARHVAIGVLRTADLSARHRVSLGDRAKSIISFDPSILDRIAPRIVGDPDIQPPSKGYISPGSGKDKCHYCRGAQGCTIDHIVPVSIGGSDRWWNRVAACVACNSKKSNLAPECGCDRCRQAVALYLSGYREC